MTLHAPKTSLPRPSLGLAISCFVLGWLGAMTPTAALADGRGVTLFDAEDFRGDRQHFDRNVPYFERGRRGVGDDQARSIRVDRGCEAVLFSKPNFRGRSVLIQGDLDTLRRTPVGLDNVSSMRVECRSSSGGWTPHKPNDPYGDDGGDDLQWGDGIVLYEHKDMRGERLVTRRDIANLRETRFGNDRASSIDVAEGCRAVLYRDANFRGERAEVRGPLRHLGRTPIGNDSVSSVRVECERRPSDRENGITLFEHEDFRGRQQTFTRDIPNLKYTAFGNDRASSVAISRGCEVTLYEDKNYRGRSVTLRRDDPDLGASPLGNDRATSMRIECRRRR